MTQVVMSLAQPEAARQGGLRFGDDRGQFLQ
jgi:hypothetical protein